MISDIILALIAILGPIISGVWSYKSAVKKSEDDLEAVREKNKADIKAIKIQSEEIEKIKEQALAESRLYENKTKTDLTAKQFDNPKVQKMIGNAIGAIIDKEARKHFNN